METTQCWYQVQVQSVSDLLRGAITIIAGIVRISFYNRIYIQIHFTIFHLKQQGPNLSTISGSVLLQGAITIIAGIVRISGIVITSLDPLESLVLCSACNIASNMGFLAFYSKQHF